MSVNVNLSILFVRNGMFFCILSASADFHVHVHIACILRLIATF